VQPFFHAYGQAQNLRENAAREYINQTVDSVDIEDGTLESYESALITFNEALAVLPSNTEIQGHINHIRQQIDQLNLAANQPDPTPDPTPLPPGVTEVTDMRFNYGVQQGTYTGAIYRNRPHGFGTFTYDATSHRGVYTGEWAHEGLRHGQGRNVFRNGNIYDGNWHRGSFTGQGTLYYTDGFSVTGSTWGNSVLVGQGVIRDSEGRTIYEGGVDASQDRYFRQGTGTEFDAEGNVIFTGNWVNNNRQ
jgi:hypothetical protein